MRFQPTLREGLYICRDDSDPCHHEPPTYVRIKETASAFVFTWHPRTLDAYRGLLESTWHDGYDPDAYGQDGDDWLGIIRSGHLSWMWSKPNSKGLWQFSIRKSGSQHAAMVWSDTEISVAPYRNGSPANFYWVSDK